MQKTIVENSVWVLPLLMIALSFSLKIFVNRSTSAPQFVAGSLELPVDIVFLSMSLTVAHIIAKSDNANMGTAWLLLCLVVAVFIVAFWRVSINFFEKSFIKRCIALGILNFAIAMFLAVYSVQMIAAQ